jgi:hypothetical protein
VTPFSTFILTDAALLGLLVCAVTWIFKTSAGAIGVKVALALSLAVLACWTPLATRAILGYPQARAMSELPDKFQLFAMHSVDDKSFDLWIAGPDEPTPLAVTVVPDPEMRKALRQAQQKLGQGQPVFLSRSASDKAGDGRGGTKDGAPGDAQAGSPRTAFGDDQARWTLTVPSARWTKSGDESAKGE